MADDNAPNPDAPQDPPPADPPAQNPPPPPSPPPADDGLGEAGKKALEEERKARRDADKALKAAQAELDKARLANMSETERAIAKARDDARAEMAAAYAQERVKDKVALAASGKLADPDDAIHLLGNLAEFVAANGDVDTRAIASAIDGLVASKPYLAPVSARPAPLPGGGATPSSGFSMDDYIRNAARSH